MVGWLHRCSTAVVTNFPHKTKQIDVIDDRDCFTTSSINLFEIYRYRYYLGIVWLAVFIQDINTVDCFLLISVESYSDESAMKLLHLLSFVVLLLGWLIVSDAQALPPPLDPVAPEVTKSQSVHNSIKQFLNKAAKQVGDKHVAKKKEIIEKANAKPEPS